MNSDRKPEESNPPPPAWPKFQIDPTLHEDKSPESQERIEKLMEALDEQRARREETAIDKD